MATIIKRGPYQWQARIRKKGHRPISKTFCKKQDAKIWANEVESKIERYLYIDTAEAEKTTLGEALERYSKEITPRKKIPEVELGRIKIWRKHKIASFSLVAIRGKDIAEYRDQRLAEGVSSNTIRLELAIISHLYTIAQKEWGMEHLINPVKKSILPKPSIARDRRLSDHEEEKLLRAARQSKGRNIEPMIILALETAARRSEIVSMKWKYINFKKKTWLIPISKNKTPREVPLSTRAIEILRELKGVPIHIDGYVFKMKEHSVSQAFRRCCRVAKITDLHFHDLRHEATSRFFEMGLNMMEVSTITGHKDLKSLKRYTHLRASDIARKIG